MTISKLREALQAPPQLSQLQREELLAWARDAKQVAVDSKNEALSKELWCLEQAILAHDFYSQAFDEMKKRKFYDGWCLLERAELALFFLAEHFSSEFEPISLDFVQAQTIKFQSLFPYRVFMSPEFVELEKVCSICKQVVSIRRPCGHRTGEIYGGELCTRNVTKMHALGMAMVDTAVQKYSVPFLVDPKTRVSRDHYDYALVAYLVERLASPYDGWEVHWSKRRHPHSLYKHVGRNDPCPCGSKTKYKKCCLTQEGVLRPHCEFVFNNPPPPEMLKVQYAGY